MFERSSGAIKTACDIQMHGKRGPGRPKMSWKALTEKYRCKWNLEDNPCDKGVSIKCEVCHASSEGSALTLMILLLLHVNLEMPHDDDDGG